jgi:hypothetical protein
MIWKSPIIAIMTTANVMPPIAHPEGGELGACWDMSCSFSEVRAPGSGGRARFLRGLEHEVGEDQTFIAAVLIADRAERANPRHHDDAERGARGRVGTG